MKNIHILPTSQPSRLYLFEERLILGDLVTVVFKNSGAVNQNIYITFETEVKRIGDYVYDDLSELVLKITNQTEVVTASAKGYFKVILTTDQDLIKDGVQPIDDEFLEWFVQNPSCEEIDVQLEVGSLRFSYSKNTYKIIIPKEEPKERLKKILGTKHTKQERMYSEEEVLELLQDFANDLSDNVINIKFWFEQNKKK